MIQHVTYVYQFNLVFAQTLVKDLSPEQIVQQPNGVINHPAWSLGHLVTTADSLATFLGLESQLADGWEQDLCDRRDTVRRFSRHILRRRICSRRSPCNTSGTPKPCSRPTRHRSPNRTRTRRRGSISRRWAT